MKKKAVLLVFLLLSMSILVHAQTGIGTTSPDASARLEVAASDKGFLPPRIALTGINVASPVTNPSNGLLIFNTASAGTGTNRVTPGYYFWNNSAAIWQRLASDVNIGDVKTGFQSADHNGWIRLDGRAISTLTAAQQAQATALGLSGNLPNADNAVLMQQSSGTMGSISGSMSRTLAQNELPNISPTITVNNTTATMQSAGSHQHPIGLVPNSTGGYPSGYPVAFKYDMSPPNGIDGYVTTTDRSGNIFSATTSIIQSAGAHTHTIDAHTHTASSSSINGGVTQQAIDITPRSIRVNTFIYLGI